MQTKFLIAVTLTGLLISGCATQGKSKASDIKKISLKIAKLDLDNDNLPEVIKVEVESKEDAPIIVTIARPDKSERASFQIPGVFDRIEFAELNNDGYKQIAVFYHDKEGRMHLVVYRLKNDTLFKIFAVSSACGLDAEFGGSLPRVKVGKPRFGQEKCLPDDIFDWEIWVWQGDRFILQ
ncbi:MAG: hypothetical protein PHT41_06400 [Candidatus Omnitrophica bacterium]|nr:hypothetical protein [Candidatus Omnitrophota bacterium]MDD5238140.1 hypothetical protein [Candidatus Omnitrophota bacterium]